MSLVLTNAGEKLEVVATIVMPFTVHYADYVGATPAFTPGVAAGNTINGTKDLLVAPGSGQRVVRTISVHNNTGGAGLVIIQLDDGGANYTIMAMVLDDEYSLYYDEDGWKVLDDNGAMATTLFEHAILGPHHSDAATDAASRGSMIIGNATPAWDELIRPGTAYHLQTDANDIVWAQDITMADDAWIGLGAALERLIFKSAGYAIFSGCDVGIGVAAPDAKLEINDSAAVLLHLHETDSGGGLAHFTNTDDLNGWYIGISGTEIFGISRNINLDAGKEFIITQAGRIGLNILAPAGQVHADQSGSTAGIPVLVLDQADTSEGVINFIALARGIIGEGTSSVESVRVELNGTVYRLALYVDA